MTDARSASNEKRTVIVTGAGRGVGRGVALAFATEGDNVAVLEIDPATATDTEAALRARGVDAIGISCDVGDKSSVDAAVAQVVERWGRVDVVINNAQAVRFATVLATTDDDADVMWRSGFLGSLHVMQAAQPHLAATGGVVINVISGAVLGGFGESGIYGAVKAAIRTLTRAASNEWGPLGIRVLCISPSAQTPALDVWKEKYPEAYDKRAKVIPLQRFGDPETDIGRALVALASADAHYITGATVTVDGGAYFL
jgi:NAD(P)-dependent dehydrogenase (short-subunit alcohol dehydrogenase family)